MRIERRIAYAQEYQQDIAALMKDVTRGARRPRSVPNTDKIVVQLRELGGAASDNVLTEEEIDYGIELANVHGVTSMLRLSAGKAVRQRTNLFVVQDELARAYDTKRNGSRLNNKVNLFWGHPYQLNGVSVSGVYITESDGRGTIFIAANKPGNNDVLSAIATKGRLPTPIETEWHEKTHGLQFNLVPSNTIPREFIEAQAYRTRGATFEEEPHDAIVEQVVNSPAYTVDRRRFNSALWTVDRLNALGFSQLQIVYITSRAGPWDDAYGVWVGIDSRLQREMYKRGLSYEALERMVVEHGLKKAASNRKARTTTQRTIYNRFGSEIDRKRARARRTATTHTQVFAASQ